MGGIARRCAGGRGYNVLIPMAHSVCVAVDVSIAASRTSVGSIAALCAGGLCDNCLIAMGCLGQSYLKAERSILILFPGISARSLLGTGRLLDDLIVIVLHGQLWKRYNRSCLALAACSFQLSGCGYRRRNGDFIRIAMVCHRGFRILIGTTANRTGMGSIALFRTGGRGYNILVGMLGFRNHGAERECSPGGIVPDIAPRSCGLTGCRFDHLIVVIGGVQLRERFFKCKAAAGTGSPEQTRCLQCWRSAHLIIAVMS